RQYSKKAMPQETRTTTQSAVVLNFRCPYQANVMKIFDARSIRIGKTRGEKRSIIGPSHASGLRSCDEAPSNFRSAAENSALHHRCLFRNMMNEPLANGSNSLHFRANDTSSPYR